MLCFKEEKPDIFSVSRKGTIEWLFQPLPHSVAGGMAWNVLNLAVCALLKNSGQLLSKTSHSLWLTSKILSVISIAKKDAIYFIL